MITFPFQFFKINFYFFQNQFSQSSINWFFKPINIEKIISNFHILQPSSFQCFKQRSLCPLCISYSTCQLTLINKYQPCLEVKLLVWWFWCHLKLYESILYLTSLLNWSMYIISSNTIIKSPDQYNVLVNCFPIIYFNHKY